MTTLTLARHHAVNVGGITYWNDALPCQAPPTQPTAVNPKLTLVPPGTWKINAKLTIVALAN